MKTDLCFHTLWRQSWHNNITTSSRHLKVRSFHTFFIHFSYPWRSLGQSCPKLPFRQFDQQVFIPIFPVSFHTLVFIPWESMKAISREQLAVKPYDDTRPHRHLDIGYWISDIDERTSRCNLPPAGSKLHLRRFLDIGYRLSMSGKVGA